MARFFFYGTLLDADVRRIVFGRSLEGGAIRAAVLDGFRPARVRGLSYPILVERPGAQTAGIVVSGLSDGDVARLVYYEEAGYAMQEVSVAAVPGRSKRVWAFIPRQRVGVMPRDWSLAEWRRRHKPRYLAVIARMMRACPGFARLPAFLAWRARRGRPKAA